MKNHFFLIVFAIVMFTSCKSTTDPTPSVTNGKFTAKLGTEIFTSLDAKLLPALGGTIATIAKDSKGRYFQIAIFEKDFPANKAIGIAYSPSLTYFDDKKAAFVAKSGTMTITAYTKTANGILTNIKGTFSAVMGSGTTEITVTEGKFDLSN